MFDTTSVFDAMALDDSDRRVASRRALALAQTRIDNTLGRFLRGAVTMEEFELRLAACQDEFALHVAETCDEVGHDQPEHVAKVLASHYLDTRRWQPERVAQDIGEKVDPAKEQDSNDGKPVLEPHQDDEDASAPKIKSSGVAAQAPQGPGGSVDPWGQGGVDPYTCHGCGQESAEFAQQGRCPHCGTTAGRPAATAAVKEATPELNTDLGGPEPVMDKRLWSPENLGDPQIEDGHWPTVRKDITESLEPNNEHPLKETGEKFTETQSLPNNTGDAGFDAGGPGPAPHTDTWGKGDQQSPVTRETQPE